LALLQEALATKRAENLLLISVLQHQGQSHPQKKDVKTTCLQAAGKGKTNRQYNRLNVAGHLWWERISAASCP